MSSDHKISIWLWLAVIFFCTADAILWFRLEKSHYKIQKIYGELKEFRELKAPFIGQGGNDFLNRLRESLAGSELARIRDRCEKAGDGVRIRSQSISNAEFYLLLNILSDLNADIGDLNIRSEAEGRLELDIQVMGS